MATRRLRLNRNSIKRLSLPKSSQVDNIRQRRSLGRGRLASRFSGINADMTVHYTFDSGTISGATVADQSGNGRDGTLVNVPITGIDGPVSQAVEFHGVGQQVTVPLAAWPGAAGSISLWALAYDATGSTPIVGTDHSLGGLSECRFETTIDGTLHFYCGDGTAFFPASTHAQFAYGDWHHVVVTWEWDGTKTTLSMYIDGVVSDIAPSTNLTGPVVTPDVGLAIAQYNANFYNGRVDDFRIYNKVLDLADVVDLYALGSTVTTTTSTTSTTSTTTTLAPTTTTTSTTTSTTTTLVSTTTSTTTTVAPTTTSTSTTTVAPTTSTTTTLVLTTTTTTSTTTSTTTTVAPTTTTTTTVAPTTTTSTTTTIAPTTSTTTTTVAPTTTTSTTTTVAPTTSTTTTSTTTTAGTTTTTTTALYETDFSEYSDSNPLSDWTERWNTGGQSNVVEACDCAAGMHLPDQTQHVAITAIGTYECLLSWDDLDGLVNVDVLMLVGNINDDNEAIRLVVRGSGTEAHENGYFVYISNAYYIAKLIDGSKTNLSSVLYLQTRADQGYWWRFRVQGNTLKCKFWNIWTIEPDEWHLECEDSDIPGGGWIGISTDSAQVLDVNYFGVATGGRTIGVNDASPLLRKRRARYFGTLYMPTDNDEAVNWVDAMGGQMPAGAGRYLVGIRFRTAATSDDSAYVRLAVYSGGSLSSGPDGATLLADSGQVLASVVGGWNTYTLPAPVEVPSDAPLWVALKANDGTVDVLYWAESGICGDYQIARGRFRSDTVDTDESVAWPSTWPADGGSFSSRWRAVEAIFDSLTTSTTSTTTTT